MRAFTEMTLLAARVAAFPLVEVQLAIPVEMVATATSVSPKPPVSLLSETAPISETPALTVSEQPPWVPEETGPEAPSGMQQIMQDQQLFLQLNELVSRVPSGALATWLSKNLDPLLLGDLLDAFPQFKS